MSIFSKLQPGQICFRDILAVSREVVVLTIGDPLQFTPAERSGEEVFDICCSLGIMGQLGFVLLAFAQSIWIDAEPDVPVESLLYPLGVKRYIVLLAGLQDDRIQEPRRVAFHMVPTVVVNVQVRLHAHSPSVAAHHVIHKLLQEDSLPPERAKSQRLHAPGRALTRLFGTREPHLKGSASVPEPMHPRRRNHRNALVTHSRV